MYRRKKKILKTKNEIRDLAMACHVSPLKMGEMLHMYIKGRKRHEIVVNPALT